MDTFPDLSNLTNIKKLDLWFDSRDSAGKSYGESYEPLEEYLIPRWMGNLSKLEFLCLSSHFVTTSPTDLTLPPHLKSLVLDCPNLGRLPRLPESLVTLSLDSLKMDTFPDLSNLTNLKGLVLQFSPTPDYDSDGESDGPPEYLIPQWIGNLSKLESLRLHCHFVTTSPTDLTLPPLLKLLHLRCPKLRRLPRLSSSLSSLHLEQCESLCSMESLHLSSPYVTTSPTDLTLLPHLDLPLYDCRNLHRLLRLPSSLSSLCLERCKSLCSTGDLSNLKNLSSLVIPAVAIEEIQGLGCLENLRYLELSGLGQWKTLPDLSNLNKLKSLRVGHCDKLVEIQGELPQSLVDLDIHSCKSLHELPNPLTMKALGKVVVNHCGKLNVEAISSLCSEKSIEFVGKVSPT